MTSVSKTYQNVKFDPTNFNKKFEANNKINKNTISEKKNYNTHILYHSDDIILGLKDIIYILLDFLNNKKNPLPFIFSNEKYQLLFALLLIISGTIILLFSNILR
jgi:hypothetical protein